MWIRYLFLLCLLTMTARTEGQPGALDHSFGQYGQATACTGPSPCFADDVVLLPDGRFLVAGSAWNGTDTDFAVWRFQADGSLDDSFGSGGVAVVDIMGGEDRSQALTLRPDGGMVLAGYGRMGSLDGFALAAFDAEGQLDMQFGDMGVVRLPYGSGAARFYGVAMQPDGKILAAGMARIGAHNTFTALRLQSDGMPDSDFGNNGVATIQLGGNATAFALALQSDGRLLLAGQAREGSTDDFALVRLLPNGHLDLDFGVDGIVLTDIDGGNDTGYALGLQPDGRILVGGTARVATTHRFALVRYTPDGTLDPTFGEEGIATTAPGMLNDIAHDLAIQEDGRILLAGRSPAAGKWHFSLSRFESDGTPDMHFGDGGSVLIAFGDGDAYGHAIALGPNQRLLMVGSAWIQGLWYVGMIQVHLATMTPSQQVRSAASLVAYPNPSSGLVFLEPPLSGTFDVIDSRGIPVQTGYLDVNPPDFSGLSPGLYFLRIRSGEWTGVVMIKRP
jgi:uncharacterized delta-60 repeat protein